MDKVTKLNLFFLWTILTPDVCCNIPYFLARYLADHAVSSRVRIPICGGHFVTHLARSYGVIIHEMTRSLICKEVNEFSLSYFETMRVVINMGTHWSIHVDDEEDEPPQ